MRAPFACGQRRGAEDSPMVITGAALILLIVTRFVIAVLALFLVRPEDRVRALEVVMRWNRRS